MDAQLLLFGGTSGDAIADRRFDFALQLAGRGDHHGAADLLRQAIERTEPWPPLHFHLGEVLRLSGAGADARRAFGRYLALDPADAMGASVKLALLDEMSPASLPPAYVQSLFDQYAPRFDRALVDDLHYRTPELIAGLIFRHCPGRRFSRALDLGCGTGLAMAPLRGMVDYAEGVDLSPAMVEQARRKSLYDRLAVGSIDSYLRGDAASFALVLAADVFVYVGALDGIFGQVARRLSDGGLFAFSVQATGSADGFRLGADHRYSHGKKYIADTLNTAGLSVKTVEDCILREDQGRPVEGHIVLAGR